MATSTPNYDLRKPDIVDRVDVLRDLAENFDKIDAHDHDADYAPLSEVSVRAAADTDEEAARIAADAAHAADTTSIHGITDTSTLETTTGSAAKVTAHEAAANPHPDYTTTAELVAHAIDTTAHTTVATNRQTASYGLVVADAGKVVEMNVASGNNLTVPLNATQAFAVGTVIELLQYGAGQTTIVATGGVTLRSSGGKLKLAAQYAAASLRKIATDEWAVAGELSA